MPLDFISKILECTRTHTQFVTVDPNCTKDPYIICYSGSQLYKGPIHNLLQWILIVERTHTQFVTVDPDCTKDSYTIC